MDDLIYCRTCGHFKFLHEYTIGITGYTGSQYCDPRNDHGCNCEEFIPEGNLNYLEYKYDKLQYPR